MIPPRARLDSTYLAPRVLSVDVVYLDRNAVFTGLISVGHRVPGANQELEVVVCALATAPATDCTEQILCFACLQIPRILPDQDMCPT